MKTNADPVSLLERLVAYPTVSNRPVDAIVADLAEGAEALGGRVQVLESSPGKANVIARFGPHSGDGLTISGHMDVVPTDGQEWTSDPFKLSRRDGRLYGRGSADMKGFLAATMAALSDFPLSQLRRELALVWTHDEEVGCIGSGILAERWDSMQPSLPTQAWIGEPTDARICRMHPGHCTIEIKALGRAAHSSRPSLGVNAISLIQRVLAELEGLAACWRQRRQFEEYLDAPYTVMNVGLIQGGSAINIVPDACTLQVGFRPLPGVEASVLFDEIEDSLARVQQHARFLGGDVQTRRVQTGPALLTEDGTPLQAALCPHAVSQQTTAAPFATDGGNLQQMGLSCLVFGPGSIDVAHRPDEYIDESALRECVGTVQAVVQRMCVDAGPKP